MEFFLKYIFLPMIIFIAGYIILRLAGKKAVSEMNSFDMLFILVLGTIISEPLVSKEGSIAIFYSLIFSVFYILFSILTLNNKFRWILVESPTVIVRDGDIDEKGLRKVRMNTEELIGTLRQKGYQNTADIEIALMEDMGKISVIPKANARPLQPSDIQLQPSPTFIPIPIIMNGEVLDHNLKYIQKDEDWLKNQLGAWNIDMSHISDVTLAVVDQDGSIRVDTDYPKEHDKGVFNYKPGNEN